MKAVLEGLLFLVGDEGISLEDICEILEIEKKQVKEIIETLKQDYQNIDRGLNVKTYGNNYKMVTKSEYSSYYQKLTELTSMKTLSQSALETLAIIAYNEPITRAQVDDLRGVSSSQMIRKLVAKEFVKELGRSEALGRPILYGITNQFLDYFGLSSKEELPKVEELKVNTEDIDLYNSKYVEVNEEIEQL